MTETAQQNRYQRALEASISKLGREQSTSGHTTACEFNHKVLTDHAPAGGPNPRCLGPGCNQPWPCDQAESAMSQVGVRSCSGPRPHSRHLEAPSRAARRKGASA